MKAKFTIEKPSDIEFTMTITMKLTEWEHLRDQLDSEWPSSDLNRSITHVLCQTGKTFCATDLDA